jgi:hypothetical protein
MKRRKLLEMEEGLLLMQIIKKKEMINHKIKNQGSIYLKAFSQNISIVNGVMQNSKCLVVTTVRDRLVLLIKKVHT